MSVNCRYNIGRNIFIYADQLYGTLFLTTLETPLYNLLAVQTSAQDFFLQHINFLVSYLRLAQ